MKVPGLTTGIPFLFQILMNAQQAKRNVLEVSVSIHRDPFSAIVLKVMSLVLTDKSVLVCISYGVINSLNSLSCLDLID